MDTIIYHGPCSDGFCAAWLCYQIWPKAKYVPAQYGGAPPDIANQDVLIVDFSYGRNTLLQLQKEAKSIRVLDHHKTAKEDLVGLDFCTFDMNKSGARLTFDYLIENKHLTNQTTAPWLVDYTEDRDLWLHKLSSTEQINAAIRSYPFEFEAWNEMHCKSKERMAEEGEGILRYKQQLIANHIKHAEIYSFLGYEVMGNCCTVTDIWSEVAGGLAKNGAFGFVWLDTPAGRRIYSLRSAKDGIDVSELCKTYGGGGHKHAAGFDCDLSTIRFIQKLLPRPLASSPSSQT